MEDRDEMDQEHSSFFTLSVETEELDSDEFIGTYLPTMVPFPSQLSPMNFSPPDSSPRTSLHSLDSDALRSRDVFAQPESPQPGSSAQNAITIDDDAVSSVSEYGDDMIAVSGSESDASRADADRADDEASGDEPEILNFQEPRNYDDYRYNNN